MDPLELLNSLEAGIAAIAPGWKIASWSPSAARLTGRPADDVIGADLWSAYPPLRRANIEEALHSVLSDGTARTVRLPGRTAEGGPGALEIEACRGDGGHLLLLIRSAAESADALPASVPPDGDFDTEGRLYQHLFEVLPTPALILSDDGRVVQGNSAAAGLLGAPNAMALRGRPLTLWIRAPEFVAALTAAAVTPQRLTVAVEVPGSETAREAQVILTVTDPEQGSSRLLLLAVDVTREILLQRRLVQADRLSQLGALVSGVAHELNNPLAAISAFAELLHGEHAGSSVGESAEIIHQEALKAGRIIRTLLDFAKNQQRNLQPVSLPEVVDRVFALQRNALKKARVTTSISFGTGLPLLRADPRELQQVLLNAVVNAGQAIAATGKPGKIMISARQSDGFVQISIEDDGPGVPPEVLERAFEPFFTTKGEEGTGLGLSISFGLIRAIGGRMWLQNVEGNGARLSVEIPIDPGQTRPDAPTAPRRGIRPLSVLIVEDQPALRRGVELLARRLGHSAATAGDPEEAFTILNDRSHRFDALLVDVHLNEGRSGFDIFDGLLREAEGRERLVIFTTGDSISPETRDRLERSERPVLRKPFALDELRIVLDRMA